MKKKTVQTAGKQDQSPTAKIKENTNCVKWCGFTSSKMWIEKEGKIVDITGNYAFVNKSIGRTPSDKMLNFTQVAKLRRKRLTRGAIIHSNIIVKNAPVEI